MRGKKSRELRRAAIAAYPLSDSKSGYLGSTYYGPQWRRFHRWLKRGWG